MNLIVASQKGDLRSVHEAIARGENINHTEIHNVGTALFAASKHNHLQVMHYLLVNGADTEKGDENSDTPLIAAISRNHVHAVRLLLHFGANSQCSQKWNNNKYRYALDLLVEDNDEMIHLLLQNGAKVSTCHLHKAANDGQINMVRRLLLHGVAIDTIDAENRTALHYSCKQCQWPVAKLLLEHFADVTKKDEIGMTPLHCASLALIASNRTSDCLDVMQMLLDRGANVNEQTDKGLTALHFACKDGRWSQARFLLQNGAHVTTKDNQEMTPLHYASLAANGAFTEHLDVMQMLLKNGANANESYVDCWTPLHHAAKKSDVDLTRLLLVHGASVHAKNIRNDTPLFLCFPPIYRSIEVAELLLDYGAHNDSPKLNALLWDWKQREPLHMLRPKCLLNWYFCLSNTRFDEGGLLCLAVSALNDAMLEHSSRNVILPFPGEVTNASEIVSVVVSIIDDLLVKNPTSTVRDI
jgi:ankyrin repeat protein